MRLAIRVTAAGVGLCAMLMSASPARAADPRFCDQYARAAVNQAIVGFNDPYLRPWHAGPAVVHGFSRPLQVVPRRLL